MSGFLLAIAVHLASAEVSDEQLPSAAGTAEDLRLMQAYGKCAFAAARRLLDFDPSANCGDSNRFEPTNIEGDQPRLVAGPNELLLHGPEFEQLIPNTRSAARLCSVVLRRS